jgi:hypothetical protein
MSAAFAWFVALAASASMQMAPSAQQQAFDAPRTPLGAELPPRLGALVAYLRAEPQLTSSKIRAAVDASGVTEEDLQPWADFEHSAQDSYGRKVRALARARHAPRA